MASLFQIVYTSTASRPFGRADLVKLLRGSVQRNTQAGITGMLLYLDGTFMQVLEGEEKTVIGLYSRIRRDPRHHHVIPLIHERIKQRDFPDSAMSFRDLETTELRKLAGYSQFLNIPRNEELPVSDIPKSRKLLLLFKEDT